MNIKNEFLGWQKKEVLWLILACTIIALLSVYGGDDLIGIISATTGVACVVLTGKGKLSAYLFGLINAVLYAIISYEANYFGEMILNIWYVPMQFVGFYTWKNHMNDNTLEVNKKRMTSKGRIILSIVVVLATFILGYILKSFGGELPYIDAFSTVVAVVAMIISIRMYMEQWYLWIVVNCLNIVLWSVNFAKGGENLATLLMWMVYLLNAIFSFVKWNNEASKKEVSYA